MPYDPRDLETRFHDSYIPEPNSGCWLWIKSIRKESGYGSIGDGGRVFPAHRISYELHRGEIEEGLLVCHKCDVRSCVNPDHLFLGTQQDNMDDMREKHREARNETHGRAKLTDRQVQEIRDAEGYQYEIAEKYSISRSYVAALKLGYKRT